MARDERHTGSKRRENVPAAANPTPGRNLLNVRFAHHANAALLFCIILYSIGLFKFQPTAHRSPAGHAENAVRTRHARKTTNIRAILTT